MSKKSQVTIYVIIGLIILIGLGLFYYYRPQITEPIEPIPLNVKQVNYYIGSCVDKVTKSALIVLGSRGGYIELKEPFFETEYFATNYLYYIGDIKEVSKENIERELSTYVNTNLPKCANLSVFKEFEFKIGDITTNTTLNDEVRFDIKWPIELKQNDQVITISHFSKDYNVNFSKIINAADSIMEMDENVDIIRLLNLNLNISLAFYPDMTVAYRIIDEDFKIDQMSYNFIFANKYEKGA